MDRECFKLLKATQQRFCKLPSLQKIKMVTESCTNTKIWGFSTKLKLFFGEEKMNDFVCVHIALTTAMHGK